MQLFSDYITFAFTDKLLIWRPIFYEISKNDSSRYTQTMHLLVSGILQKIQFRFDSELKILDNEYLDDDVSMRYASLIHIQSTSKIFILEIRYRNKLNGNDI